MGHVEKEVLYDIFELHLHMLQRSVSSNVILQCFPPNPACTVKTGRHLSISHNIHYTCSTPDYIDAAVAIGRPTPLLKHHSIGSKFP